MKDLFSSLKSRILGGGGRSTSTQEKNKFTREEELQFNSNYDSLNNTRTKGGELYLNLNTIISNKSHIGGGSKSFVNEDCATLCSNDKGGARHYLVSATSSDVKLNASDHCVGGGHKTSHFYSIMEGGKLFNNFSFSIWNGGEGVNNAFTSLGGEV